MVDTHYHWHKQVGETKTHVYFQCACGSRSSGIRVNVRGRAGLDEEWLAGANRAPQ